MSKLTVREQEALTQTIIDKIADIEMVNAEADFKNVKKQFEDIKNKYQHIDNERTELNNKCKILSEDFDKLLSDFNKDRKFVRMEKETYNHYRDSPLDKYCLKREVCYHVKGNISRDVIIATLKSKEDVQQLITDLVYNYSPRTKLKVAS